MMLVKSFTFNPFQENTYVLSDDTKNCVIVDPGCYNNQEQNELLEYIKRNNLTPQRLLNTHAHIDHVFGNRFVSDYFNLDLELHDLDLPVLDAASYSAKQYGLDYTTSPLPKKSLKEGNQIKFGNTVLDILHIPGHAPGHVVFYNKAAKIIIGGDVLFRGSIGRTDLPGGNHQDLIKNIKSKLFTLEDDIVVYSGHGPSTTIGYERKTNPFF
ncbi:MAG: MBL fold metallo-hydrolase [Flavobacteriales bacterium]|nr:MBL fold metallo-hydrolase [Flavobacteriales bacterium]